MDVRLVLDKTPWPALSVALEKLKQAEVITYASGTVAGDGVIIVNPNHGARALEILKEIGIAVRAG